MTPALQRTNGFAIIELALVLIVIGILAAVFVPMAQVSHEDAMRTRDMDSLESAKVAMLGYARANSGLPCVNTGGVQVSTNCDPTNSLDLLGVRTTDSRGRTFAYDVNDSLTFANTGGSWNLLCTALINIINAGSAQDPSVCATTNANTGDSSCTPSHSMAFVLVGRGNDRCLNLENSHANAPNDAVCPEAVDNNRTFENPARLHSRTTDDGYYEDLVLTFTPAELAEAMQCPPGGSNPYSICEGEEVYLQVTNGDNGQIGVALDDGACQTVGSYGTRIFGCISGDTDVYLSSVTGNCSETKYDRQYLAEDLDNNGDGHADVFCAEPPSDTYPCDYY